jgi:hypothetical protein
VAAVWPPAGRARAELDRTRAHSRCAPPPRFIIGVADDSPRTGNGHRCVIWQRPGGLAQNRHRHARRGMGQIVHLGAADPGRMIGGRRIYHHPRAGYGHQLAEFMPHAGPRVVQGMHRYGRPRAGQVEDISAIEETRFSRGMRGRNTGLGNLSSRQIESPTIVPNPPPHRKHEIEFPACAASVTPHG